MFESHHQLQKASKTSVFDAFLLQKRWKWCGSKCGSTAWPTPWPTRRNVRKGLESTGQEVSPSCHVFFALLCSLDLLHEVAHSFRYFVLLLPGGVGVSAEGESGLMVAQFIILSWSLCHSWVLVWWLYSWINSSPVICAMERPYKWKPLFLKLMA